ncbi:beta-ketoacyl-[acyl-carrier-protein] synthase family protein [Paenirhodobacter populi]|uniref:Beta-ketoacyl-[acyl-carrier-protein] synthase family protein n=1 Tax=Paenirhodobacter populi TaxID=2306993 RepID=A0A443J2Z4_9RHOB|nr:beta-ketoacyl-[acyl-carrier-protein] synthase family protein [Sinirhodobacter populi]RWR14810.1 beta-ketoacyl-[acyl-carrier-protein] synthase family protein [Sinirhodobacter populi]
MRRVVITGAGTVNALAQDVPGTWAAMAAGRSAIGVLEFPDVERLSIRIGAQVRDWRPEDHLDRTRLSLYDRFTQFALVAGAEAMAQAGLTAAPGDATRWGAVIGTAGGGNGTVNEAFRAVFAEGRNRVHPFTVPRLMNNAAASHLSMQWGLTGPVFSVATACSSSNHAIGLAFQMIRAGMADGMLAGGAEAMLNFGGLKAWEGLRVMSPDGCHPFSLGRNGMVQGEGAGVFVLEERDAALARGATILAEVRGFCMTSDAGDIVMPSAEGAARTIGGALADAGVTPADVGYVNAHGTGTAANDRCEAAAIHAVFGARAEQVPVSSTKAMHGHCIGATGAIELLACIMALRDGVIAPTIGYEAPDPDCRLDVVPNAARQAPVEVAISNAFAFGGLNAVLVLSAG